MNTRCIVLLHGLRTIADGYWSNVSKNPQQQPIHFLCRGLSAILLTLFFAACSEEKPAPLVIPAVSQPTIDISGAWSGTWSGTDPTVPGLVVSGNWEAEVTQTRSGITGFGTLLGDVDCMDGSAEGSLSNNVVSGTLSRTPCKQNAWTMSALNLLERSTSGTWTQPGSGASGVFAGIQIAKPGGPRISFLNPSGGAPGAIITVVGTGLGASAADNSLDFNAIPVAGLMSADTVRLVARVPYGAKSGHAFLTTSTGTAISPRPFNTNVTFPNPVVSKNIYFTGALEGVAISPDGRKAYVANKNGQSVSMINTATGYVVKTTYLFDAVQGVAVSPDGKRIYVANGTYGIRVLDAAVLTILDTIPVDTGGGTLVNPQGLAVSPDGRLLYVSDNKDGGAVTVLDIASKTIVASLSLGGGATPLGIAPSPDGTAAYMAFTGPNEVKVFDLFTNSVVDTISVGSRPTGIAVTPNGGKVFVSNGLGNSVTVHNAAAGGITTIPVGSAPAGIAISPDGSRVYVVNSGGDTVSIINTTSDQVVGTVSLVSVGYKPVGIAMSPDGKRAYITSNAGNVYELGGPMTLTITKNGSGMGTVTSSPEGITCGSNCQARFDYGTMVTLSATADGGSYFSGWSGDCSSGTVTMTANKTCTATFTKYYTGSSGGSGGGGGGGGGGYYYYGGCYIATAAYGSSVDPHVKVLADFHDRYFTTSRAGKALTEFYHAHAPSIADYISRHKTMRIAVRAALIPMVYAIQYPAGALLVVMALAGGAGMVRKKRADRKNRSKEAVL